MVYKVGIKVICLTDNWSDLDCNTPVKGKIYTIREIADAQLFGFGLTFEEIRNPIKEYSNGFHEVHFWWNNFRPIHYNMEINYEILESFKPVEERADIEVTKSKSKNKSRK